MPMGEYKTFQDCVDKNKDKENPEAYCGEIKHRIEDVKKGDCPCDYIRLLKSDDGQFIIYGPASVEIKDKEGDKILEKGLEIALPQLLRRARLSLGHEDILVGEILPEFQSEGKIYKTEVANKRLMLVANIWDDTQASQRTRQQILDKTLRSFSISGEVYRDAMKKVCDQSGCVREISKLDLHAVTICREGMNPAAKFEVLQKEDSTVEFITIATPHSKIDINASVKETEVTKIMTDTKPPVEAKKEDAAPGAAPASAGSGGSVEEMCKQMLAMMKELLAHEKTEGAGGAGAGAAGEMGKTASADPKVSKDLEDLKKKVAEQDALIAKLQAGTAGTTPRPETLSKTDLEKGAMSIEELLKNPEKLAKMSSVQIEKITAGA